MRIIAASAVVVLHYSDYVKDFSAGHFMLEHAHHFNWFVDLFFVVSGFVIASQYLDKVGDPPSIGRFIWRRLARIYPLHLATLAFYTVLAVAVHFGLARTDNPARYLLSDIPTQLLLLHAFDGERLTFNFPSWSLSAEMFCYVIFPIMALLAARRQEAVVVLVAILALANILYSAFSESEPWTEWINKGGAFRALPSFTLGVASCLFRFRIARWPVVPGALLAVLAAFILLGWLLSDMAALVVVYAIAILAIQCDMTGTSTLLTPVATTVLTLGSRNLAAVFPEARLALLPAAVAVLAVASILSYRLFETPLRRSLNSAYDRHFTSPIAVPAISSQEKSP